MTDLYWIHEDALRMNHPAALAASENAHHFFIWDEKYLQAMDYGFHRLHFIYEALCDMCVTIYKGDTLELLKELQSQHDADALYAAHSVNPRLQKLMQDAESITTMHIIEEEPFVVLNKKPELKRFFRYWNKAQKVAFEANGSA